MRSVVSTLFVVNWLSRKSIAIGKRGNILSCDGGNRPQVFELVEEVPDVIAGALLRCGCKSAMFVSLQ